MLNNETINITNRQRTIATSTSAVIINNRITIPDTIEFRPAKSSTNIIFFGVHRNIFNALRHIDPTLTIITF